MHWTVAATRSAGLELTDEEIAQMIKQGTVCAHDRRITETGIPPHAEQCETASRWPARRVVPRRCVPASNAFGTDVGGFPWSQPIARI